MSAITGYNPATVGTLTTGTYRHMALSISGTWHTLYLDGVQVAQNLSGGNVFESYTSAVPNVFIGCAGDLSYGFAGSIDDFKIWNRALPTTDISAMYWANVQIVPLPAVTTNLSAYFPLNNTTKELVSGLSVTAATTVTYNTVDSRTGINCTSSSGYGTSGIVNTATSIVNFNIPTFTLPFTTNGVSFSIWFYPTDISTSFQTLLNLADNNYNTNAIFLLVIKNNSIDLTYANYATGYHGASISSVTITNNNWYHLVVTLSSNLTSVHYLNNTTYTPSRGVYAPGGSLNGFNVSTNNRIAVGCNTGNAYNGAGYKPPDFNSFTGTIAKIAIYNTILSAGQVSTLFAAG